MFDTYAHIHDTAYDADRETMLRRAWEAGISRILTVGCDIDDSKRALEAVREYQAYALDASIGIHPHAAKDAPTDIASAFDKLIASAARRPIAVGETGLDYYYENSSTRGPSAASSASNSATRANARYHSSSTHATPTRISSRCSARNSKRRCAA